MSRKRPSALLCMLISAPVAMMMAGCSGMETTTSPDAQPGVALTGTVHGGQQPVSGAHVYLYATSTGTNYGGASTSLLGTGTSTTGLTSDGTNYYATTNAAGSFTITNNYACPSSTSQVYLLSVGGNPGLASGTNNTAISLMAAVGSCGTLTPSTYIVINEVTTAASVTALQQFMTTPTAIGTSTGNVVGIQNAFLAVPNLVTLANGGATSTPVSGTGSAPQAKLNTLGNILASCVNSASSASTQCASLFSDATPSGGTAPSDVASAMLLIAKNPSTNVSNLFNLSTGAGAPFSGLPTAPNDLTLPVTFKVAGLTAPTDVVIDASGNAWAAGCPSCSGASGTDSITGISPSGALISNITTGIHKPQGIAFDSMGNLWSTDQNNASYPDQVLKQSTSGAIATGFPYTVSLSSPVGVALDFNNAAWVSNQTGTNIVHISSAGLPLANVSNASLAYPVGIGVDGSGNVFTAASGPPDIYRYNPTTSSAAAFTGGGLNQPVGIAIDNSDDVWTINSNGSLVTIINGVSGNPISGANGYAVGISYANAIAIDGAGTAWVANCRSGCTTGGGTTSPDDLLHFNSAGTTLTSTTNGLQDSNLSAPAVAAIDPSGNVWVSNNTGNSLTEFVGVAAPVKTPLAVASAANQLGVKP